MDQRRYLKPEEAAELIGVTPGTLANWRCEERGPPYYEPMPKLIRYATDDIEAWIGAHPVMPER